MTKKLGVPRPQVNPLAWGAVGAVICVGGTLLVRATYNPEAMNGYTDFALVAGGLFWGMAAAAIRNWLARRQ